MLTGSIYGNSQPPSELPSLQQHTAHVATSNTSPANLVAFAHAALFSTALSTLEEALCHGHVHKYAGLTLQMLQKHLPQSEATIKGQLYQTHKNLCSTKPS